MKTPPSQLPVRANRPVRRLLSPLRRFIEIQSAGGVVLLLCAVFALVAANSRYSHLWDDFWHTRIVFGVGTFVFERSLEFYVNDGLMTIFFFLVGLEIKREIVDGELSEFRQAAFPVMGAIGGMLAPAFAYYLLHPSGPTSRGWGVPMATDIAFVVGVMALLGRRAPASLKIFLLALAIADDIGAVLVIAFAYTAHLQLTWLYLGLGGLVATVIFNLLGVRSITAYVLLGIAIWICFLRAEVHPTVAGVILGLLTPVRPLVDLPTLRDVVNANLLRLRDEVDDPESGKQRALLGDLAWASREAESPLERIERGLHPLVSFVIMPIFALANAGVSLELGRVTHSVAIAVALGLVVGKPVGIFLLCRLAVLLRLARMPMGVNWWQVFAGGCLGGIGFTMAIFVAGLAFEDPQAAEYLAAAKVGTLLGSLISATLGALLLAAWHRE